MRKRQQTEARGHHLYQRGEIWWCKYSLAGEVQRVSLRTSDAKTARIERDKLLTEASDIRAGRAPAIQYTWDNAANVFLEQVLDAGSRYAPATADRYRISIVQLTPVLTGCALSSITTSTVSDFVNARREDEVRVSTIKNDLTAWSMVLSYAATKRMCDANAVLAYDRRWLGNDAKAMNPPIDEEVAEMVEAIREWNPDMALLFVWLRETGMRLLEALSICREDIHPDGATATLRHGVKRNRATGLKTRVIRLGRAAALLDRLPKRGRLFASLHTDSAVISSRYGQWRRQRQDREDKAARANGRSPVQIREWGIHNLRHAFAIASCIDNDTCIYRLMEHLGHSSVKTTELYLLYLRGEGAQRKYTRRPDLFGSLCVP